MSIDRNHSEQFERYLKGQMSSEEAHAFEREVLDDRFAQEALEGFEASGSDTINDLKDLRSRIESQPKKAFPFMRIAVVVALLILGSVAVLLFTERIGDSQLAMEKESVEEMSQSAPAPDTLTLTDKSSSKPNDKKSEKQKPFTNVDEVAEPDLEAKNEITNNNQQEAETSENLDVVRMVAEAKPVELDVNPDEMKVGTEELASSLQSSESVVEVKEIKGSGLIGIDSASLAEVVVTAQPLVAKRETLSYAVSDVSEDSIEKEKKAAVSRPAARSRSATVSTVDGRVSDEYGEPLPGVNVIVKGTTSGVTTDVDGNYQIAKTNNQTLVFSYVGFESQEVEVGNRSTIDVTMGGATALQEVVVTGYGGEDAGVSPSYSPASPSIGNREFKAYLEKNLQYPQAAIENDIEGTVVLEITINPSGQVYNIDVKKSLGYGCDEEAVRLINEGPEWKAANKDGTNVEDKVRVKVRFKLN